VITNKQYSQQKAALTRAINSGRPMAVLEACRKAKQQWDAAGGAWPDDWSRWQRALDDSAVKYRATYVTLEDI
jgi:hypothetical protein